MRSSLQFLYMTCLNTFDKKLRSLKISPFVIFAFLFVSAIAFSNSIAEAAKLADGTWSQSGAPGTTTVTFTNTGLLEVGSDIVLTFPDSATLNDVVGGDITVTGQTTPTRSNNTLDNTITITLDTQINATTSITITMTDALSVYTATTYAQESLAINTQDSGDTPIDFGVAIITNTNTTTVTASVPLFVTMEIDETAIALGTLSVASISSGTQQYTINSNNQTGITMQIASDGKLDDASTNDIDDVADSTVTAGSEEYGIAVTTSGLTVDGTYISGDNPVPQAADDLASSAAAVSGATLDITYKASIAGTTVAGQYDQVVTVTIATNS